MYVVDKLDSGEISVNEADKIIKVEVEASSLEDTEEQEQLEQEQELLWIAQ